MCRCSELLYTDAFTIKCVEHSIAFFPSSATDLDWSFIKHRWRGGESYKQDLTSGIDWIDSTKLSSNDSQIASFTATERWQSRKLWEVHTLSSNCNFKSADRAASGHVDAYRYYLQQVTVCTIQSLFMYQWTDVALTQLCTQNQLHHECSFLLQVTSSDPGEFLLQLRSCVSKLCEPSANYIPRRLEIMSYAGIRLTSCGTSRAFSAFPVSCTALTLHLCSIDALCSNHREVACIDTLKRNSNLSNLLFCFWWVYSYRRY